MPSRSLYLGQDSLLHGLETNVVGSFPPAGDAVTIGVSTLRRPSAMLSGSVTQRFRRPIISSFLPLPASTGSDPALFTMTRRRGTLLLDTKPFPGLPAGLPREGFTKTCSIAFPAAIFSGELLCWGPRHCYSTSTPRRIIEQVRAPSRRLNHCITRSQLDINLCKVPSLCECVDVS